MSATPPFTKGGDRKTLIHGSTGFPSDTYTTNLATGGHRLSNVGKGLGGQVNYSFDGRGNRLSDDDTSYTTDRRDFTYDARDNLLTVTGKFKYSGTTLHDYVLTNAYDQKNRRFFKSFKDTTASPNKESQWFFYYDLWDRLIEVKYTPDVSASSTYSLYQLYWIGQRPIAYWQIDYPSVTTSRRYFDSDEMNRPLELYSWPTSGNSTRLWASNPDLYGADAVLTGATYYQPLRFPGQYQDAETATVYVSGNNVITSRPPLHDNRYRVYDPYTGGYLQADPELGASWDPYAYSALNPVGRVDSTGSMGCYNAAFDAMCNSLACLYKRVADVIGACADGKIAGCGSDEIVVLTGYLEWAEDTYSDQGCEGVTGAIRDADQHCPPTFAGVSTSGLPATALGAGELSESGASEDNRPRVPGADAAWRYQRSPSTVSLPRGSALLNRSVQGP
jgi:RHS repeat-associated protein